MNLQCSLFSFCLNFLGHFLNQLYYSFILIDPTKTNTVSKVIHLLIPINHLLNIKLMLELFFLLHLAIVLMNH